MGELERELFGEPEPIKTPIPLDKSDIQKLTEAEQIIALCEQRKKEALKQSEMIKRKLLESMKATNTKSFESDNLKITYVAPIKKKTIDTKRLKLEQPEVAEQYMTENETSETIRITMRGN